MHRAAFYWSALCTSYVLGGPPFRATDILCATEPRFLPHWPAGWALYTAGGLQGLELLAELCIASLLLAALAASASIGARAASAQRPRPHAVARGRLLAFLERAAVCCCAPCFALLHAVQFSLVDYQHQYHCVLYSLFALALVGPGNRLTPRLILVVLVHTYASAGVAKALNASGEWVTGDLAIVGTHARTKDFATNRRDGAGGP